MRWKRNKWGAVKTKLDGYTFDSKAEAMRYGELKLMENAKEIFDLEIHPEFTIRIDGIKVCDVVLDFGYLPKHNPRRCYEHVKGRDNALSRLKRKLVEAQYGINVKLIPARILHKSRLYRPTGRQ